MTVPVAIIRPAPGDMGTTTTVQVQTTARMSPPSMVLTYSAGAAISGHRALMFDASHNVIPADPNADGYTFAGVSTQAAAAGADILVAVGGLVIELTWTWSPGPVFVSAGGVLTQVPPMSGVFHQVATALSATAIHIAARYPILRNQG